MLCILEISCAKSTQKKEGWCTPLLRCFARSDHVDVVVLIAVSNRELVHFPKRNCGLDHLPRNDLGKVVLRGEFLDDVHDFAANARTSAWPRNRIDVECVVSH